MRTSKILLFLMFSNFLVLVVFCFAFYIEFTNEPSTLFPLSAQRMKLTIGAAPFVVSMVYLVFAYSKHQSSIQETSDILDADQHRKEEQSD